MAKYDNIRINTYFIFILAAAAVISYNLFVLTYVRHYVYSRTVQAQSQNISNMLARGNIYLRGEKPDRDSAQAKVLSETQGRVSVGEHLAATNKKSPLAYIVPVEIDAQGSEKVSGQISSILGTDASEIKSVIDSRSDKTRVLSRRIKDEQVAAVKELGIKGFGVAYEMDRFYPGGSLAANVLGFLGYSGNKKSGQYGVEAFYDDELFGRSNVEPPLSLSSRGRSLLSRLGLGSKENGSTRGLTSAQGQPADIVLSIDKNIQQIAEGKLSFLMEKWEAAGGTIIIQDPNTGAILAMADRPTFDPNNYSEYEPRNFLNRGMQEIFEPGSSFKPITMAMGLDLGAITPQTTFNDVGFREEAGYRIKNFSEKIFGTITMSQVLEKSVNTGAMYVQDVVENKNFLDYIINFGFGQKSGIDLPGEIHGDISNLYSSRKINFLTASFGQGIAVTPLQLINAYSAIANGGKLMRPYVVEKIVRGEDKEETTQPEIVAIVISEKTATKLKLMLTSVVDNGFDKAWISGYDIAGKTGTAQIPDNKGGYLENEYIHNFVGFAPALNPKFVILIKIDKPKGITFAADSLSPVFKEITQFLLNYYGIPPTRH